jgi:hypothetical protein
MVGLWEDVVEGYHIATNVDVIIWLAAYSPERNSTIMRYVLQFLPHLRIEMLQEKMNKIFCIQHIYSIMQLRSYNVIWVILGFVAGST